MAKVSVELVPRDEASLRQELAFLKENFRDIDRINLPDLLRYEMRSWEAAKIVREYGYCAMPHIRAIDIDLDEKLPMKDALEESGVEEVLVITGDPPQEMSHKIYPTVSTDIIRKFREEMPSVRVYAGIDQYRSSMREELYNIRRKLQAGAAGFFTQPFYDMRYLQIYAEILSGNDVYWGVAPVTSERSMRYWESKNNVIFPRDFRPDLEWNIEFARRVRAFAQEADASVYFMPIRIRLKDYLPPVLQQKRDDDGICGD